MATDYISLLNLTYEIEGLLMLHINRGEEASPEMTRLLQEKISRLAAEGIKDRRDQGDRTDLTNRTNPIAESAPATLISETTETSPITPISPISPISPILSPSLHFSFNPFLWGVIFL